MQHILRAFFFVLIISVFIMRPAVSYADWNGHDNSGHDHGSYNHGGYGHGGGHSYVGVNLSLWPDNYYYGAPYYPSADEVLVSPPIYEPVLINGITYYLNDGIYYVYNGYSYQPVASPVTAIQQPETVIEPPAVVNNQAQGVPAITMPASTGDTSDSFTINIPNDKGGYTAVTLKKSGNGFIGPQGEFYPEFPRVSQLKVIYGK